MLPAAVEADLAALAGAAPAWAAKSGAERAKVARACRARLASMPTAWLPQDLRVLGLDPDQPSWYNTEAFEPFLFVSIVARWLDGIAEFLEGKQVLPEPTGVEGAQVFALGPLDAKGLPGAVTEVWSDERLPAEPEPAGGLCVVLGAGNHNFLTFCDVLDRAFLHKNAVFLKHHPLRPHLLEPFEHLLEPLMCEGAFAHCSEEELGGQHTALLQAPGIAHVHFTGSAGTHNKVAPLLKSNVGLTAELSNVTPWIVCPGDWDEAAVKHHAKLLALAFKSSCSMLCLAPKVLVLPTADAMPLREEFLAQLKQDLAELPQLPPYYPGAHGRYAAFKRQYPQGEEIHAPACQEHPPDAAEHAGQDLKALPSLLVDVGTLGKGHSRYACETEAFGPVLAVATVDAGAADYPLAAARAVNQHVTGSLTCNVVYPGLKDVAARDETLDRMLAELRYGAVSVNLWSGFMYSNPAGVWGAYPGLYSRSSPGSGCGFVGNVFGVKQVQKAVALTPFVNKQALKERMPKPLAHFLFALITGMWSYLLPSGLFCRRG